MTEPTIAALRFPGKDPHKVDSCMMRFPAWAARIEGRIFRLLYVPQFGHCIICSSLSSLIT